MREIERLRAALEWYASRENYVRQTDPEDPESYRRKSPRAPVELDGGARARDALDGPSS